MGRFNFFLVKLKFLHPLVGVFIFVGLTANAQTDSLTQDRFLDYAERQYLPDSSGISRPLPRFPLIRSYELRTETDEFDPGRQELNLRFNLSTPKIQKAQRRLANLYREQMYVERQEQRYLLRYAALEDWQRLQSLTESLPLLDSLLAVQEDQLLLTERLAAVGQADFPAVLDRRERLAATRLQRKKTLSAREGLLAAYALPPDAPLRFAPLPSPAELARTLTAAPARPFDPRAAEQALDRRLNEAERNLNRAEQRQWLDFAQLGYSGPTNDPFRERFSIQAAILLNTDGKDRLQLEELRAERQEDAQALAYRQTERARKLTRLRIELLQAIESYEAQAAADAQTATDWSAYLALARERGPVPALQLAQLERRYRRALDKLEQRVDIMALYAEWQFFRGTF